MKSLKSRNLKLLKDTGLLQSDSLAKLLKVGIDNADSLYLHIWVERDKISKLLNLSHTNLGFLGIFLLDFVEKDTLILVADKSLFATDKPVKIKKQK